MNLVVSLGPPLDPRDVDDDGDGYTENQGDCDDAAPARNPGAADTVGNAVDENCDGIDGVLPIASIVVEPANDVMVTGNDKQYTATATLTDGTSADVTSIVVWQSGAPGVATRDRRVAGARASRSARRPIRRRARRRHGLGHLGVRARSSADVTRTRPRSSRRRRTAAR